MRAILVIVLLAALIAVGVPPQVKHVTHTFEQTEVEFWYPTVIRNDGLLHFTDRLVVRSASDSDWAYDGLRSARFICTKHSCASGTNPVFDAWTLNQKKTKTVQDEAESFKAAIARARAEQASMEQYLAQNSCAEVSAGPPKPTFACSESESQEVATTTCAIRELGAKACEKVGKDSIDVDVPKFFKDAIAREGCGTVVHEITGESYSLLDKTIKKYTTDLPITLLSEFIGLFSGGAKDAFDWTVAAAKTQACIPSGIQLCRAKYVSWQTTVTEHFAKFDQHIKYCQQAKSALEAVQETATRNEGHLQSALSILDELRAVKSKIEASRDTIDIPHFIQTL